MKARAKVQKMLERKKAVHQGHNFFEL